MNFNKIASFGVEDAGKELTQDTFVKSMPFLPISCWMDDSLKKAEDSDSLVRVKKAIDDMITELTAEMQDEIKHKNWCVIDFSLMPWCTSTRNWKSEQ